MAKTNGHDANGRFNSDSPGRPLGVPNKTTALRKAMNDALTPEAIRDVVIALLDAAKAGDVQAAREVLNRGIGKVAIVVEQSVPMPRDHHDERAVGVFVALHESGVLGSDDPNAIIDVVRSQGAKRLGNDNGR